MKYAHLIHYTFASGAMRMEGNFFFETNYLVDSSKRVEEVRMDAMKGFPLDRQPWVEKAINDGEKFIIANIMRLR